MISIKIHDVEQINENPSLNAFTDEAKRNYLMTAFNNSKRKSSDKLKVSNIIQYKIQDGSIDYNEGKMQSLYYYIIRAYKKHYALTLSPDVIFNTLMLHYNFYIAQNSEDLRSSLVGFDGKRELRYETTTVIEDANVDEVVDYFSKQIRENVNPDVVHLFDLMECNFSTSDSVAETSARMIMMSGMQNFFTYDYSCCICGIPRINLDGTKDDWILLQSKIKSLTEFIRDDKVKAKFTNVINHLQKFIDVFDGKYDEEFWKSIITYDRQMNCVETANIDGWMTDFFIYEDAGNVCDKFDLNSQILTTSFCPFKYSIRAANGDLIDQHDGIFATGLMGVDKTDNTLTPKIGWFMYVDYEHALLNNVDKTFKEEHTAQEIAELLGGSIVFGNSDRKVKMYKGCTQGADVHVEDAIIFEKGADVPYHVHYKAWADNHKNIILIVRKYDEKWGISNTINRDFLYYLNKYSNDAENIKYMKEHGIDEIEYENRYGGTLKTNIDRMLNPEKYGLPSDWKWTKEQVKEAGFDVENCTFDADKAYRHKYLHRYDVMKNITVISLNKPIQKDQYGDYKTESDFFNPYIEKLMTLD